MTTAETPHVPVLPPPRAFFAVSIAMLACFAVWSWLALGEPASPDAKNTLPALDWSIAHFWRDWNATHLRIWRIMVFMTDLGGVPSLMMLAVMGFIWQNGVKHRFLAIAWLGIMIGGAMLNQGTKWIVGRDRPAPELRDRAVLDENLSYPSGHSMGSMVGFGMLAYALILPQRRRSSRIVTVLFLSCLIGGVGFSRLYLRAHWFSDVVGGWFLGLAWLFFCIGLLERRRLRLHHDVPLSATNPASA